VEFAQQALSATIYSDSLQSVTVAVIVSDTTPIVHNGLAGRVTGVQKTEATFLTQVSDGVPSVMYPRAMTLGEALGGKRGEDANRPPRSERAPVSFGSRCAMPAHTYVTVMRGRLLWVAFRVASTVRL
jgi:hypothetical protein